MRRIAHINHSTLIRVFALFMLSVMTTLLVGKSVHTYIHITHACEQNADSEGEYDHHDCKICNFEQSTFDGVEESPKILLASAACSVCFKYFLSDFSTEILARSSRAPPQSII